MSASGRLQKRAVARHKFPLYPLVCLCLLLEHMEKAKAKEKEKGERPGLARLLSSLVVFKKSAFAFSLARQKEQAPPLL